MIKEYFLKDPGKAWMASSISKCIVLHLTFGPMFENLQLVREENLSICIQTCFFLYYSIAHFFRPLNIHLAGCLSPTLCSGRDRGPFDLSLSNHAWFCCGLSALVTLGLIHDTGSYSFVFCFPCSFAVALWIPMAVHMYLLVNKILLLNVSGVQRLLEMFGVSLLERWGIHKKFE